MRFSAQSCETQFCSGMINNLTSQSDATSAVNFLHVILLNTCAHVSIKKQSGKWFI